MANGATFTARNRQMDSQNAQKVRQHQIIVDVVMYSGAVQRKRVSEQVTPAEAWSVTRGREAILNMGLEGDEAPKSHLRVASSPSVKFSWQSRDYSC